MGVVSEGLGRVRFLVVYSSFFFSLLYCVLYLRFIYFILFCLIFISILSPSCGSVVVGLMVSRVLLPTCCASLICNGMFRFDGSFERLSIGSSVPLFGFVFRVDSLFSGFGGCLVFFVFLQRCERRHWLSSHRLSFGRFGLAVFSNIDWRLICSSLFCFYVGTALMRVSVLFRHCRCAVYLSLSSTVVLGCW